MKTAFLITARLKSTRLPKKVMLKIMDKPLIVYMIDRIKHAKHINKIIICTSTNSQDDPLEEVALAEKIHCFRGSENDVLQRLLEAAKKYELDYFANITADAPMIDPILIGQTIEEYKKVGADLIVPTEGTVGGCMVVKVSALEKVCEKKKEVDTEVWVRFFKDNHHLNVHTCQIEERYKHESLKTSLDYPEDFKFIKKIFSELYNPNRPFSSIDLIDLVKKRPDILAINSNPLLLKRWKDHIDSLPKDKLESQK